MHTVYIYIHIYSCLVLVAFCQAAVTAADAQRPLALPPSFQGGNLPRRLVDDLVGFFPVFHQYTGGYNLRGSLFNNQWNDKDFYHRSCQFY